MIWGWRAAGVACAAVDTSANAITAALYKDSPHFGAIMGVSESMISIGYNTPPPTHTHTHTPEDRGSIGRIASAWSTKRDAAESNSHRMACCDFLLQLVRKT